MRTPSFVALSVASGLFAGCTLIRSAASSSSASDIAPSGAEVAIKGEMSDKDGVAIELPVRVAKDRTKAFVEIDGEEVALASTGDRMPCDCATFADDDFVLFVRFSGEYGGVSGASATLTRFDEEDDERQMVDGILEEDGLDLKVKVVVAENQESVTFTIEGEAETLAWDKGTGAPRRFTNGEFEAKVHLPAAGKPGNAKLSRLR